MLTTALLVTVTIFSTCGEARRYRTCDEGCCVHEYCAYHRICYPRIHCGLGCPDGQCVGQDHQLSEPVPQREGVPSRQPLASSSDFNKLKVADVLSRTRFVSERYSYKDTPEQTRLPSTKENSETIDKTQIDYHDTPADNSPVTPTKEVTNGICMPLKPCQQGHFCGMGHSCTFNYNLGYAVCQYNLDIGSTLCYDNKGNPILQSLS